MARLLTSARPIVLPPPGRQRSRWLPSAVLLIGLWGLQAGCIAKPRFEPGPRDADASAEFTTTQSGLKYRVLRRGNGAFPQATQAVQVHYEGRLLDTSGWDGEGPPPDTGTGRIFDSSYRTGEPADFGLRQVIPGWTEGMQLIDEGGMIELIIPPELGYGENGVPGAIPPGATLRFLVELIEIR